MTSSSAGLGPLPVIAVIGNPNTGKSTLFNSLTGLRQKTANYPGVTVERHTGTLRTQQGELTLVDLPGTYSLAARSPDEMLAIDVLLGHVFDLPRPRAILAVADATNLRRNLFLTTQLTDLGIPVVLALNMSDLAARKRIDIDCEQLGELLGIRVVPVVATSGDHTEALVAALREATRTATPQRTALLPDVELAAKSLWEKHDQAGGQLTPYEVERALIDAGGVAENRFAEATDSALIAELHDLRSRLSAGSSLASIEAKARYDLINSVVARVESRAPVPPSLDERIDRVTSHPVIGPLLFVLLMATIFQAVFAWSGPLMDTIDGIAGNLGEWVSNALPPGAVASLLVDGVIAGVGSVVIFLPQILILFAFIIFLEDSGYMPRAAFMMDRAMRSCGLSGQSFIPMLSSFACAVPGILATRVIPDERDRLATILAAPFMTCSARLPVYALLIGAFVPARTFAGGLVNLQGLVLLGLYLLGIAGGIATAFVLKRLALKGPTPAFLIELPPYRLPNLRSLLTKLLARAKVFLVRAGTVIFTVAVVIWALAYFPRPAELAAPFDAQRAGLSAEAGPAVEAAAADIDAAEAAAYLEQSWLGRMGQTLQPAFSPLGWDWKVTAAVIASFPAREVVIAVLGTIYAVGDAEANESTLSMRLQNSLHADGDPVFTLPMVLGLLVFYAFCLQCGATVAVIARETNSWRWPVVAWAYMTGVGYLGALLCYQLL